MFFVWDILLGLGFGSGLFREALFGMLVSYYLGKLSVARYLFQRVLPKVLPQIAVCDRLSPQWAWTVPPLHVGRKGGKLMDREGKERVRKGYCQNVRFLNNVFQSKGLAHLFLSNIFSSTKDFNAYPFLFQVFLLKIIYSHGCRYKTIPPS